MSESVLVVGGGTMGAGIAALVASRGMQVEVVEPDEQGRNRLHDHHPQLRVRDAIPERIEATLVIEAVLERMDIKRAVFAQLAAASSPQTLLATNTSSLSISEIGRAIPDPSRLIGLHFFNPPHAMKLIEIVRTELTLADMVERALAFVESLGKQAIVCADTPGFVVNRVARPYYLQAMHAYEAGVASYAEIDALARGAGFRMGPFELMDLIGIDINLATTESVYEKTNAERLAPVRLQAKMVEIHHLGRKTGIGFYDYHEGTPERLEISTLPEVLGDVSVSILGFSTLAEEMMQALVESGVRAQEVLNDDLIDEIEPDTSIVVDCGDGASDRADIVLALESVVADECTILVDAYATDTAALKSRLRVPSRVVGFGLLAGLDGQKVVELVDADDVAEDALQQAQAFFATLNLHCLLVEDHPGLYLGRAIAGIVNEAVSAVHEGVASVDDVDRAMCLGTNYPRGPIQWGREIGGARISRILERLARAYGPHFAPHRALWVLDVDPNEDQNAIELGEPVL